MCANGRPAVCLLGHTTHTRGSRCLCPRLAQVSAMCLGLSLRAGLVPIWIGLPEQQTSPYFPAGSWCPFGLVGGGGWRQVLWMTVAGEGGAEELAGTCVGINSMKGWRGQVYSICLRSHSKWQSQGPILGWSDVRVIRSVPQLCHVYNGENNSLYLLVWSWGLKR